ncbi:KilA-N domain-containing protein [Gemmata massiliana]
MNATELCKAAGKKWNNYWRNATTKQFLKALEGST